MGFYVYFIVVSIPLYFGPKFLFIFEGFYKFVTITDVKILFMDCDTGLLEMDNITKTIILFGKYQAT